MSYNMDTGIFLRVKRGHTFLNLDIGDPAMTDVEVWQWLMGMDTDARARTVMIVLGRNVPRTPEG